jgi:hypothetical protein
MKGGPSPHSFHSRSADVAVPADHRNLEMKCCSGDNTVGHIRNKLAID